MSYPDILFYWTGFIVLMLLLIWAGIITFCLILDWWIKDRLGWVEAFDFTRWVLMNRETIRRYAEEKGKEIPRCWQDDESKR